MATKFDFTPGIYRVEILRLNVRGVPDSTNDGNIVRDPSRRAVQLTIGKEVPVYDVVFPDNGWAWGVITPDGAPQAHYICLWDINRVFAKRISSLDPTGPIDPVLSEVAQLRIEFDHLVKWAQTQGYKKP